VVATGTLLRHCWRRFALPSRDGPLPLVLVVPPRRSMARVCGGGREQETGRPRMRRPARCNASHASTSTGTSAAAERATARRRSRREADASSSSGTGLSGTLQDGARVRRTTVRRSRQETQPGQAVLTTFAPSSQRSPKRAPRAQSLRRTFRLPHSRSPLARQG